jgi:hypothetical protein
MNFAVPCARFRRARFDKKVTFFSCPHRPKRHSEEAPTARTTRGNQAAHGAPMRMFKEAPAARSSDPLPGIARLTP